MRLLLPPAVCLASGMAAGLCLLFPSLGPAVFLCMAPGLAVLMRQGKGRKTLSLCLVFCLGILAVTYTLSFSIRPRVAGHLVFWIDLGVYVVACLLHGLFFAGGLWCGLRFPCPRPLRWLAVALFWALAEWLCGAGPLAWPVMQLGLALREFPVLIQGASWGGLLLVSAAVMAVNALFAEALCLSGSRLALCPIAGAALLFLGNVWAGAAASPASGPEAAVAVIQPGLSSVRDKKSVIHDAALALAEEAALESPDILLLPENIMPAQWGENEAMMARWGEIAKETGADLLLGGVREGRSVLFHFAPDGRLTDICQKQREVPFFENGVKGKPFRWSRSQEETRLSLQHGRAGVMICYESILSDMARRKAAGTELLLVPTNDSWFDSDIAKDIHLAHGVFRAVETGRTLVQAGMNGYTAVVDERGNRTGILDASAPGILYARVSFTARETPYQRWGNSWILPCLAFLSGGGIRTVCMRFKFRQKHRK